MDGPIRVGQRKLAIEFQADRHGADRIDKAYQRLETLATALAARKTTVQGIGLPASEIRDFAREAQG